MVSSAWEWRIRERKWKWAAYTYSGVAVHGAWWEEEEEEIDDEEWGCIWSSDAMSFWWSV